ncbi:MAG: hypothetical protein IPL26_20345 [Leptospiraceae bacterium]|nr:hypothetical protein [Leptospiraceae bacterium]
MVKIEIEKGEDNKNNPFKKKRRKSKFPLLPVSFFPIYQPIQNFLIYYKSKQG